MHCAICGVMLGVMLVAVLGAPPGILAIAEAPVPRPNTSRETINIFLFILDPFFAQ